MTPAKVVVVMPAYNAGRTLRMTYEELPKETVATVIPVDDGSTDATPEVARQLGLEIFVHDRNYGYGANQKTCYTEALRAGADVVVMVHPDYQYDPTLVPQIIAPIVTGDADVVLGSRLKSGSALAQGMPWWKCPTRCIPSPVPRPVISSVTQCSSTPARIVCSTSSRVRASRWAAASRPSRSGRFVAPSPAAS